MIIEVILLAFMHTTMRANYYFLSEYARLYYAGRTKEGRQWRRGARLLRQESYFCRHFMRQISVEVFVELL